MGFLLRLDFSFSVFLGWFNYRGNFVILRIRDSMGVLVS